MSAAPLKHFLPILITLILAIPVTSFAEVSAANPSSDMDMLTMNMKDVTVNETMRYARELFRKGDYPEAVNVFQNILRKDCRNKLARYHLQKIAQKDPTFLWLRDYLKSLPCAQYNFQDDDFLPAAFYLEKDNDLLLEQLVTYNKRYRNNKTSLAAKIAQYNDIAGQLDQLTRDLSSTLNNNKKIDTATITTLSASLNQARRDASAADHQITELRAALVQATLAKGRNSEKIKPETVSAPAAATRKIAATAPAAPTPAEELTTLQAKFSDIQQRLRQIELSIAEKNQIILDLQKNLNAVKQ